jgi:hypothetical protein
MNPLTAQLEARVPPPLKRTLQAVADRDGVKLSKLVRRLIAAWLELKNPLVCNLSRTGSNVSVRIRITAEMDTILAHVTNAYDITTAELIAGALHLELAQRPLKFSPWKGTTARHLS